MVIYKKENYYNKNEGGNKAMTLLDTIKNKIPSLRTTKDTQYTRYLQNKTTVTNEYSHKQLIELRYKAFDNNVVRRCCDVYKNTSLACGFTIDSDTNESDNNIKQRYLERIMNNPEGVDGTLDYAGLNGLIWDSFLVAGDVFFEIATDKRYDIISGFKYIHNNKIKWNNEHSCYQLIEKPDVLYDEKDLIHIRTPNPLFKDQHFGISVIDSCAEYIALMMNAIKFNNNILTNNGLSPDTILSYDSDVSEHNFNAEVERLQLMKEEADKTGGMLVTRGATFQKASNTNKDMNYLELMKYCRDQIIQDFGIPPQIYGIVESAHLGSGTGESQKKDWKLTFEGRAKFVETAFNDTFKRYGFTERFKYGLMDVEDELYNAQVNQIYLQNGIKDIDEVRNEMGLDRKTITAWGGYYR